MSEHTPTPEFYAYAYADHDELVAALPASPVDRLGSIRAEIKALQDEAKKIETWVKAEAMLRLESPATFDGALFTATVSTYERVSVDWCGIARKLGQPSHQLKSAHTKVKIITKVCVSAHKK